jgi:hypothetical protein
MAAVEHQVPVTLVGVVLVTPGQRVQVTYTMPCVMCILSRFPGRCWKFLSLSLYVRICEDHFRTTQCSTFGSMYIHVHCNAYIDIVFAVYVLQLKGF